MLFDTKGTTKILFYMSRQEYFSILSLTTTFAPPQSANKKPASAK